MSSYIAAPLLVLTCGVLRIVDGLDGGVGMSPTPHERPNINFASQ